MSNPLFFIFFFFTFIFPRSNAKSLTNLTSLPSPYLSAVTFLPNYNQMIKDLKIYVYDPQNSQIFKPSSMAESEALIFQESLLKSFFVTSDPEQAHLFYLPFPAHLEFSNHSRSVSRYIRDLRMDLPFWNRTLGADHFYVSCDGIGIKSDRNLVELKKNSIQISCFPVRFWSESRFIPHKDVILPPLVKKWRNFEHNDVFEVLAYYSNDLPEKTPEISRFLVELKEDPDFLIESPPSDPVLRSQRLASSRFCLFFHGFDGELGLGEALGLGCVPVVISNRPIFDLPFTDVLKWSEFAVFVGTAGGVKNLKSVLERTCETRYEAMRELGRMVSRHFAWYLDPQPHDSFHTLMFELWWRRHVIRYTRRQKATEKICAEQRPSRCG